MGWKSVSGKERLRMDVVPLALIKPTEELIQVAAQRLQEGKVDELGRKKVYLEINSGGRHRVYEVSNVHGGTDVPRERLASGFFVYQMDLNKEGVPIGEPQGIQTPCLPDLVSQDEIFILRGIFPEAMVEAATDLRKASVMSEAEWDNLLLKIPRKEEAARQY